MNLIMGKADDYRDFSDELVAAATGDSLVSVDGFAAAGTGYVVGNILTLVGGTFTAAAQVEVLTIGGSGEVTSVRLYNAGAYTTTVFPGDPVSTTGGDGSACTLNCTFAHNGWTVSRNTTLGLSVVDAIIAGSTGYSVDDIITLAGGTTVNPAQLIVTGVSVGVITSVDIYNGGSYSATPGNPVAQESVQPTGGSGATFTLSWAGGLREVVLEGEGGGSDEIFVGWRTLEDVSGGYYNLELHGFTGYDADLPFTEQPGISRGLWDADTNTLRAGSYLMSYPVEHDYFLSITPYRIIIFTKLTGRFFNSYMGWGNRFATTNENPYPLVIAGNTSLYSHPYSTGNKTSGLIDPWRSTDSDGSAQGPMQVYMPDGVWYSVWNSTISASARNQTNDRVVIPCGEPGGVTTADGADKFMSYIGRFHNFIPQTGLPAAATATLRPTGDNDDRVLLPNAIVFEEPAAQVVAELDDLYWVHAHGGLSSEDRIIINGDVYKVFQNCNRTEVWAFMALKE